jgi:Ca2+-binding RTX toxin-like protein
MTTFTGTDGNNVANAVVGILLGFSGGTLAHLQDGVGDTIDGSAGDDQIILANSATNTVTGGLGQDELRGGAGDDRFFFHEDNVVPGEIIHGGAGLDVLVVAPHFGATLDFKAADIFSIEGLDFQAKTGIDVKADFLAAQFGSGEISSSLEIFGRSSAGSLDYLRITMGTQTSFSGAKFVFDSNWANDDRIEITGDVSTETITGTRVRDLLRGNNGDDTLNGGADRDTLIGGSGDDRLDGGKGGDLMQGGFGSDTYVVDDLGDDLIEPALSDGARDVLESSVRNIFLPYYARIEDVTLSGNLDLSVIGDSGANIITGNIGDNHLGGSGGDDTLNGGGGDDTMNGGSTDADSMVGGLGNDYYLVSNASDVVVEDSGSGSGKDTIWTTIPIAALAANVENATVFDVHPLDLAGNELVNVLTGNDAANVLSGEDGGDRLVARDGHDKLLGGEGADTLIGGSGNDQLVYGALIECGDEIRDFSSSAAGDNDLFRLRGTAFGGLPAGAIVASQFEANGSGTATTETTRFIFETDTRILRFDSNGSGAGGVTVVATLQAGATIGFDDIHIF